MIQLGRALSASDSSVRSLIVYNSNPVSVAPDGSTVRTGLQREDLFTIVHEQVMTPTALYADLVLPATTFLENCDVYFGYGHFYCGVAKPVIEPIGEAMSNFDFFQRFAQKMGYDDPPFQQSLTERLDSYLATISGAASSQRLISSDAGRYVESIYNSPENQDGGKRQVHIRFVNRDDPAAIPFACLTDSSEFEHPDFCARYPFKLITPPNDKLLNSTFGERYSDHPGSVLIHPDDAADYSILEGEIVVINNFRGRTKRIARVTTDTPKGLLVAEGIYWSVDHLQGGINDLISQQCADVGGGALFHEARVQLEKVWAD